MDLGASNGGFPLLLKSMGITPAEIVAVEMNPRTFRRMRFNIESNFDCPLRLLNAAVGAHSGTVPVRLGHGSTGDSLFACEGGSTEDIRMMTLDEIVGDRNVDSLRWTSKEPNTFSAGRLQSRRSLDAGTSWRKYIRSTATPGKWLRSSGNTASWKCLSQTA
ncbi:MAG: hypothetical protein RML56_06820 [Burkholderiales bacterium]|nr:hypothetical protein [Burkholderiales bacterium]